MAHLIVHARVVYIMKRLENICARESGMVRPDLSRQEVTREIEIALCEFASFDVLAQLGVFARTECTQEPDPGLLIFDSRGT